MAVIGNVSSADFQPPGDMTDMARPPGDPDLIEQPAIRPPGRRGARGVRPGTGRHKRRRSPRK